MERPNSKEAKVHIESPKQGTTAAGSSRKAAAASSRLPNPPNSSPNESSRDQDGPQIRDVTEEYDDGYEADAERTYPDGFEDPEGDEGEASASIAVEEGPSSQADLVKPFRKLRCEQRRSRTSRRHMRNVSGSSTLKRSHSEDSLTDRDEHTKSGTASPESSRKRPRQSKTPPNQVFFEMVSMPPSPNAMDVDTPLPIRELGQNLERL